MTTLLSATLLDCARRGDVVPEFRRLLVDQQIAAAGIDPHRTARAFGHLDVHERGKLVDITVACVLEIRDPGVGFGQHWDGQWLKIWVGRDTSDAALAERLVLCRRFVREGLLTFAGDQPRP